MNIRSDLQAVQSASSDTALSSVQRAAANPGTHLDSVSASTSESTSTSADQAHLSVAASLVSQAASLPDVRAEKVQSIQAAIASGNYHVSSSDVAQSLINRLLGGRK